MITYQRHNPELNHHFLFNTNYFLYGSGVYYVVNRDGRVTNRGGCRRPGITLYTARGSYGTQEDACKRYKSGGGSAYTLGSIRVSGRYPIMSSGRGGRNAIISGGNVVGYENCGSELTPVQYGQIGWRSSSYPLDSPGNVNPRSLKRICNNTSMRTYYRGPSGIVYYGTNYVPLGLGTRWYRTTSGTYVNFNRGSVIASASPC